uniref:Uncharacterized protein n=1 Tax=Oryza rufipogon TaxID=4529 RepID=A0A0E0NMM3_ORYRU
MTTARTRAIPAGPQMRELGPTTRCSPKVVQPSLSSGASNSRPLATSTPGIRHNCERGQHPEHKRPEPTEDQWERGSVDPILNLLRKHSWNSKGRSTMGKN